MLAATRGALVSEHDLVMFDLDGVIYVSGEALPGVAEHVARVRESGAHVAFITNNASRSPEAVADNLTKLGVTASRDDVVTSAQAAARLLAERFGPGARILLLGGQGLEAALLEAGLAPVGEPDDVVAVVSGYGPDVAWKHIMRAAVLVRDGLPYVASNSDRTIPTAFGMAPGHGVLVKTISDFAGVAPQVAGKPERPLFDETIRRIGGDRPLMVGDRLDTDIEGARAVGVASLLVMTGVTGLAEVAAAQAAERPDHISADLSGLFEAHPDVSAESPGVVRHGGWSADVRDGRLAVQGAGSVDDWWRVVAVAAWSHADAHGRAVDVSGLAPPTKDL